MITSNPMWNKVYEKLLDHSVSELEVNGPDQFFVKQRGKRIQLDDVFFDSEEEYMDSIETDVVPFVQSMNVFDRDGSIFEGRMMYESQGISVQARCHIMLPPVCDTPQITLAKRSKTLTTLDSLASMGSMSTEMKLFIEMCVEANLTVVFSGQTGSGKDLLGTTLIPTPTGMKTISEVKPGDQVFNDEGHRCTVRRNYQPDMDRKYKVKFSNGEEVVAGEGHLWRVVDLQSPRDGGTKNIRNFFSPKQVCQLEVMKYSPDQYVTVDDFLSMVGYEDACAVVGISFPPEDPVRRMVDGLSIKAGQMFALTTRSIIDRNSKNFAENGKEYGNIEKRLREWPREDISFTELMAVCCNDRKIFSSLVGDSDFPEKQVVNTRETAQHLLNVHERMGEVRKRRAKLNDGHNVYLSKNMTTQQLVDSGEPSRWAVEKMSSAADFPQPVDGFAIPPYLLGLWLGDMHNGSDGRIVATGTQEKMDQIRAHLVVQCGVPASNVDVVYMHDKDTFTLRVKGMKKMLKKLYGTRGPSFQKHIPEHVMAAPRDSRIRLLCGMIDGGGTISEGTRGNCTITTCGRDLSVQVQSMVSSLGLRTSPIREGEREVVKDGEVVATRPAYSTEFYFQENFFGFGTHATRMQQRIEHMASNGFSGDHARIYITGIEPYEVKEGDTFHCLEVDTPSHMFVFGTTYIPTHNTTMLEAVSKNIPDDCRIGVAEDAPELNLIQSNVTYLHSVPWQPGMDERDVATLQWVVSQFQRNRCDKLIIGETRGKEFGDFLIAANSGMEGSMTTIHANNPVQCLTKMSNFAMKAAEKQPIRAINNDIANAVDIIVQLVVIDGKHRTSHISEVIPTLGDTEEAKITQSPLYQWDRRTDTFRKVSNMSDHLRNILDERSYDYNHILKTPLDEPVKWHKYGQNADAVNFGSKAHTDVASFNESRASGARTIGTSSGDGGGRKTPPPAGRGGRRRGLPMRRR